MGEERVSQCCRVASGCDAGSSPTVFPLTRLKKCSRNLEEICLEAIVGVAVDSLESVYDSLKACSWVCQVSTKGKKEQFAVRGPDFFMARGARG